MMNTYQVRNEMINKYQFKALVKTKELLSDPEHWTKGAPARTSNGGMISPCDKKACSWCIYGAIVKVSHDMKETSKQLLRNQLVTMIYRKIGDIGSWNDSKEREHKDVINLLDGFIKDYERNHL